MVHRADIQDRDDAVDVIASMRRLYPRLRHLFADGGYAGETLTNALAEHGTWTVEVIKRSDAAKGFEVLPCRWVVTPPACVPYEGAIANAEAWVFIASVRFMLRRMKAPKMA